MEKRAIFFGFLIVMLVAAFSAGCTSDGEANGTAHGNTAPPETTGDKGVMPGEPAGLSGNITVGELMSFVSGAAGYAKSAGMVNALNEFGDPDGEFSSGDVYIYAYGFNGTLLAHPYQPDLVGTDRSDWTDARGFPFYKASAYTAENGGGFVAYLYPKPDDGIINESAKGDYAPKIGCVMPVDDEWWIGSGLYLSDPVDSDTGAAPAATAEMISLVESGVEYALENGNEAAFEAISDKKGLFVDESGHYLYAYDYNGTLLAHPYLTDKIGQDLIDHEGAFGEKDIQMLVGAAQEGGGYVVFSWPNPDNGDKPEIKIGYVLPVDDEWWLGSGVYLSEITGDDESIPE
ncbi:putative cache sensor protein [Methanolacinia petrolearia DSM 11571]|uniref:Putative cache sensor protein n=1 Tax=Methanolacinia petrolearia (strain DSM 11571 / OCM 486 / SEBR 4847) TaxID=679926 RepID=E1RE12_METP4|nr:cache domain-containing protein [Methanolacinia petrolearia]ADN34903.1 putative cache sensor protein [Methanolacinia petrolearia DSM 11571]